MSSSALAACVVALRSDDGKKPSLDMIQQAMQELLEGGFDERIAAVFLALLDEKTLDAPTIAAIAKVMRNYSLTIDVGSNVLDIVGTGGDGHDTFNVSTVASIVAASCGARVMKQGNRSASSRCGSADFLEHLGANIELDAHQAKEVLDASGYCFLFARRFHPSMRHVASLRKAIGIRTVFNILGPLSNPARPTMQVSGVYTKRLGPIYAQCFVELGVERGLVVHGAEGLDEISIAGPTYTWSVFDGVITESVISPEDFGLPCHDLSLVSGRSMSENEQVLRSLLNGEDSPIADFVLLNASAALVVAGIARDYKHGVELGRAALQSGATRRLLDAYMEASRKYVPSPLLQGAEPSMPKKGSVLDEIVARRRKEMALEFRSGKWSSAALLRRALSVPVPSSVQARVRLSKKGSVCAEFKRRSPSKGVLGHDQDSLDVEKRVLAYARGGAAVVSVLTEPHYFDGSISDLERARAALDTLGEERRPALLLKDFVVCEEQLAEARICGADIALLIVRILSPDTLQRFIQYAESIGLDALVEVNNEKELDVALQAGATLIGVNNRNLDTFEVDLGTTERVARRLPTTRDCTLIALSGVATLSDAERLCSAGAHAILVGETLMRSDDPAQSVAALLSGEARSAFVKICGICSAIDAKLALEAGADLVGLIFAENSKRRLDLEQAQDIVRLLRPAGADAHQFIRRGVDRIAKDSSVSDWFSSCEQVLRSARQRFGPLLVGVFAQQPLEYVNEVASKLGLDLVQLHGGEDDAYVAAVERAVIRVIHVPLTASSSEEADAELFGSLRSGAAVALLLDTSTPDANGGTGRTFDWQIAKRLGQKVPVMIAGGLLASNVSSAVALVSPLAVDVCSGVEERPRHKQPQQVRQFIAAARSIPFSC